MFIEWTEIVHKTLFKKAAYYLGYILVQKPQYLMTVLSKSISV